MIGYDIVISNVESIGGSRNGNIFGEFPWKI